MYVTLVGYIILPLGIFFFFLPGEALLATTIVLSGFTGTSVAVVGGFSLQPCYYLAILWVIQLFIRRKFNLILPSRDILIPLVVFCSVAFASLIMTFILEEKVTIMNVDSQIEQLHFSKSNITQLVYLIFVSGFFLVLSGYMSNNKELEVFVFKSYITGIALVCIVTIYQIIAYRLNLPFDPIFKTALIRDSISKNAGELIYWDKRVSGPCLEASMLAYYLVAALPLCTKIKSWVIRYLVIACIFFIGVLSLSSTFLVGVPCWIFLELVSYIRKKSRFKFSRDNIQHIVVALIIVLLVFGVLSTSFNIVSFLDEGVNAFLLKLSRKNTSGQERSESFNLLLEAFSRSPFFGVGFGGIRGKDLFTTWLTGTGIAGMVSLIVFLFSLFRYSVKASRRQYLFAAILVWICMFISVPEPYNLFVWIIMSLNVTKNKRVKDEKNKSNCCIFTSIS